jgi:hypothetical protein
MSSSSLSKKPVSKNSRYIATSSSSEPEDDNHGKEDVSLDKYARFDTEPRCLFWKLDGTVLQYLAMAPLCFVIFQFSCAALLLIFSTKWSLPSTLKYFMNSFMLIIGSIKILVFGLFAIKASDDAEKSKIKWTRKWCFALLLQMCITLAVGFYVADQASLAQAGGKIDEKLKEAAAQVTRPGNLPDYIKPDENTRFGIGLVYLGNIANAAARAALKVAIALAKEKAIDEAWSGNLDFGDGSNFFFNGVVLVLAIKQLFHTYLVAILPNFVTLGVLLMVKKWAKETQNINVI